MCNVCCKEFRGWCKSFTRTELGLALLQAALLLLLICFLVFLTMHLLVCSDEIPHFPVPETPEPRPTTTASTTRRPTTSRSTLPPDVECTWTPSEKTKATTHYYWYPYTTTLKPKRVTATQSELASTATQSEAATTATTRIDAPVVSMHPSQEYYFDEPEDIAEEDGEAPPWYKNYVVALVKLKPPEEVTFGCVLTKVSLHWTLTAASCIESIEEVDSLDSFFISETYGEPRQGLSHAVADVQIHPLYQGANRSYDLAALRSEDRLAASTAHLLQLPSVLDYFLLGIGERFTILGYGPYRAVDKSLGGRRLRYVAAYTVSLTQCGAREEQDTWAPRHLVPGAALAGGGCGAGAAGGAACGAGPLCGGALYARGAPCTYCGGTPLLRAGRLYGVMADNVQCGIVCEPTLYVNVAALRDWIDTVVR
ncbi:uncharacterized protein LOC142985968 [Anticarsia gemmatalis]|uniref:uncharacterized protein LOC142985968 n=1 Tax=Anticarsia gemmatalis TaxID=129554 RepID=UPI003F767CD8